MERLLQWPLLAELRASADELELRRQFIGGSDANVILSGNDEKIVDLWLEKRGDKPAADLSDVLPVLLGSWTEAFNRQWFEQLTGRRVAGAGE